MALISIKRNVDLQPGLNAPAVFNCSQSDKGTTIMLGLMNGGNDYTVPSGVTITIRGSRSNGTVFTPVSATSSGSTVSFTLTEEMTDTAGPTLCEAVLEQGNNVLGTANFIINVEGSPMGADVPPVFTDAAWAWMVNKIENNTIPSLGETIPDAIDEKADQTDLSALQTTVAGHTGSITVLNSTVNALNQDVTENRQNISLKLDKNQGPANAGKYLKISSNGAITPVDLETETDKTLSVSDKAADAKATGDALALKANESTIAPEFDSSTSYTVGSYVYKNGVLYKFTSDHSGVWTGTDAVEVIITADINNISDALRGVFDIFETSFNGEISTDPWRSGSINPDTGVNAASSKRIRTNIYHEVPAGSIVQVIVPQTMKTRIVLYSSSSDAGYIGMTEYSGSVSKYIEEKTYIRFLCAYWDDSTITTSAGDGVTIKIFDNVLIPTIDTSLTQTGKAADAATVGGMLDDIEEMFSNESELSRTWSEGTINPSTGANATSSQRIRSNGYMYIPPKSILKITAPSTLKIRVAEYSSPSTDGFVAMGDFTQYVKKYCSSPAYFRFIVAYTADDTQHIPTSEGANISLTLLSGESMSVYPIGLHTMPQDIGTLNVIKRARQYTDIKWTPAVDLPRICRFESDGTNYIYEGVFKAGVEYTGMPYSSAKGTKVSRYGYTRMIPGIHIPFETFITAISSEGSFVSEESTYNSNDLLSTMYGSTCCGLVSYALGINWTSTADFGTLITNGTLSSKGTISQSFDIDTISLGDVIVNPDVHVALVTDIVKNSSGNVIYIEVSENVITGGLLNPSEVGGSFGGHARRKGWSVSDFVTHFEGYTLASYNNITSVTYDAIPFVNVGDELNMDVSVNYPCLPYMGEGFVYKSGYIYNSDILIRCPTLFNNLYVYKDGSLFDTFPVESNTTKITVGFSEVGQYEAFLCTVSGGNIINQTIPCHWSVTA